ncbi:hypothetical protein [Neisseria bacilliformis]|uniref:hypothetical protein n=1 Tax=Neisseria bacilliformis TaxID=267212 RepID=UPI000666E83F|nr:hypothetical protein [Neisseria bacilliformis]
MTLLLFCLIGAVCGLLAAWLCLPLRLHWFLLWTAAASLFFPWLLYTAQTAGLDAHEAASGCRCLLSPPPYAVSPPPCSCA